MQINIEENLLDFAEAKGILRQGIQLPEVVLDTEKIKVIMINEVPPENPNDSFYSKAENPGYMQTTLTHFKDAGIFINSIEDIINRGIYLTTAVKSSKTGYTVEKEKIVEHLPILEYEIGLFPNLKVIMLMGDVAKKSFNMIAKKNTKKNAIPAGSTYKIRDNEFFYENLRVFPSYIMTGGNILIEKSKCRMITDDIRRMEEYLQKIKDKLRKSSYS